MKKIRLIAFFLFVSCVLSACAALASEDPNKTPPETTIDFSELNETNSWLKKVKEGMSYKTVIDNVGQPDKIDSCFYYWKFNDTCYVKLMLNSDMVVCDVLIRHYCEEYSDKHSDKQDEEYVYERSLIDQIEVGMSESEVIALVGRQGTCGSGEKFVLYLCDDGTTVVVWYDMNTTRDGYIVKDISYVSEN